MSGLIPKFSDEEKDAELNAYKEMSHIPQVTLLTELHVTRALVCHLLQISRCLISLPLSLLRGFGTPEHKHAFAIVLSEVLPLAALLAAGVDFAWGFELMKRQTIYKLWAVYTLLMIVLKFAFKMHKHTHLIIRGAIRENRSIILPILCHSFSNGFLFICYSISNGTYLAGLFGKAQLFFSACLHIQAIITKKYLPKVLEQNPSISEPIYRTLILFALAFHLTYGEWQQVLMMIEFECGCALGRWLLTSLTEDAPKFYNAVKTGAAGLMWESAHNDSRFDESMLVLIPSEAFAMCVASMMLMGPLVNTIGLAVAVVGVWIVCPIVIKALGPKEKPPPVPKEEKKKKDKDGDAKEDDKKKKDKDGDAKDDEKKKKKD